MKTIRITLSIALLALVSTMFAQTSPGDVVADVPFAFTVAGETFPAGRYIVKPADEHSVRIFRPQTTGIFVPTHASVKTTSDETKLVFHRYGDSYFLAEVWNGGGIGKELFRSKAEKEIIARLNGSRPKAEVAVLRPER